MQHLSGSEETIIKAKCPVCVNDSGCSFTGKLKTA